MAVLLGGCGASSATPAPARTAHGVLVDVQSASIQQLNQFTLRTDDGQDLTFRPASDFNRDVAHAMTAGHMREHMALAEPVTVTYRDEHGVLVALSASD